MSYNNWKLMDKVDIVVSENKNGYNAFVVEHGDKNALETAKKWATGYYGQKNGYTIHTFDNEGFKVSIDTSAGYSSQSGRLSFWGVIVEKDGIQFKTSINSDILVELIKETTIVNGKIEEELIFARRSGVQGLLHKGMSLYQEALSDMSRKSDMKSAKKTSKWEAGGVYETLTQTDVCLGGFWDLMEEYEVPYTSQTYYGYKRMETRKAEKPKKVLLWTHDIEVPDSFGEFIKKCSERNYVYVSAGKPPARAKTRQLEMKETDLELIDIYLSKLHGGDAGRYVRELE